MRHILTALAILLALALAAAMTVPHFVDFSQHRRFFEKRITKMTGMPATIGGTIKLRLLPTPSLSIRQVQIGPRDERGFAMFEADRIAGSVAPMGLLRGDVHIAEALVDRPIMRLDDAALHTLSRTRLPQGDETGGTVSIGKLLVTDGTSVVQRPGREALTISEYNGEVEASSLIGPARGNGHFVAEGRKRHVRFSLGRIENDRTRIKALIEDQVLALRLDIDGVLATAAEPAERFDGTLSLVGNTALGTRERVQLPVRATAKAKLAGQVLSLADMNVVFGQDPQPLTLTGQGKVEILARPRYDITLSARSYDFDRPGPDGQPKRAVPAEMIRQAAELFPQGGDAPNIAGRLDISSGALIIGGQTVVSPHLIVDHSPDGIRVVKAEAELPGQTRLVFERDSLSGPGILSGLLMIDSRDPEKLNGWFNGVARTTTAAAATRANAVLSAMPGGVVIDRIEIDRGETHLSGTGRYVLPAPGVRPAPQLTLALATARLNVGDLPAFIPGSDKREEKPDLDFDIDLSAERLALEGRDIGRLIAKARRDGAMTSIERIEIAGLDGSSFIASGSLGGGSRRVTVKLDAQKADSIAAVAEQVFPGPVTEGLRRRAEALSPALIVASLANEEAEDRYTLSGAGQLGGSEVKVNGRLAAKGDIDVDLAVSLENPDSGRLARQLSGTARGVSTQLPGLGKFTIRGNPRATMEVTAEASLFGVNADIRGGVNLFQPFVPFNGIISARAADLNPALAALGVDRLYLPAEPKGTLTAKVESNLQKITLTDLKARLGETPLTGEIAFRISEGGMVAGQIKTPQIDLRPILATVLGPAPVLLPGGRWSASGFAKPLPTPLPGDLWIEADSALLDDATKLDASRFVLRFQPNMVVVEHAQFRAGTLKLNGDAMLRRAGNGVAATTRFTFADLNLESALSPALKGTAEGDMQGAGQGDTPAKLVQALAGSGVARLRGLSVAGHDPKALPRLLSLPVPQIGAIDAGNLTRRLELELAKATLAAPEARFPLVVIDGTLRLGPAAVVVDGIRTEIAGTFDLARMSGDMRLQTAMVAAPETWRGAQPAFTAQWRGVPGSMQRSLGVEQIVNGYLAAALQRDAELREIQEQDLRERAYFNRRLKAMEWEKRRNEESRQETLRAEQARLAEEERQRRQKAAEDAARRESERQQRVAQEEAQRQQRLAQEEAQRQKMRELIERTAPPVAPTPASPPPAAARPAAPLDLRPPTQ